MTLSPFSRLASRVSSDRAIFAVVVSAHACNAAIAGWFGYLSPDSWTYLRLARSLATQGYPGLDERYFAVFPVGYPLLLALTAPGLDFVQAMAASKCVNALLWIAIFLLLRRCRVPSPVAAALVLTPFTLRMAAMTWSENLMLFAAMLTVASLVTLQKAEDGSERRGAGLLLAGLVTGIASRYAFGFAMAGFLAAYLAAYRARIKRGIVGVFIAAGFVFLLYLGFNLLATGHATGMARPPADESFAYLAFTFAEATRFTFFSTLIPFLFVALLAQRDWWPGPQSLMVGLAGLAYIAIMTALRMRSHFDPFDERLLGPGWFLIAVAIALAARDAAVGARRGFAMAALAGLALWSLFAVHAENAAELARADGIGTSPAASIRAYATAFEAPADTATVIAIATPAPRVTISGDEQTRYGERDVFVPRSAPYSSAETLPDFLARLRSSGADLTRCVVDFSAIASEDALSDILDEDYAVSFTRSARRFDPALAETFRRIFRPRSLVPCGLFLDEGNAIRRS